ncbi:MAG: alcohol dehydrogenase catalytic domain-containing protein [Clostridium sp.]
MLAYTYVEKGKFKLLDKPVPKLSDARDAIVRVTMSSICSSDLHIKHGSVPRAVPGITVGHEMVGIVEETGKDVTKVKPGDRVTVNVETFCGTCFFCQNGYVNNCTDPNGGWALGCRIDGGQAEYVCVPYADQGLNKIPDEVSDEQALLWGMCWRPLLGSQNIRNYRRRHRADHWRRPHRHLYPAVRDVKEAGKDSAL